MTPDQSARLLAIVGRALALHAETARARPASPRLGKNRTHKASNAESILRHSLRTIGLRWSAWIGGDVADEKRLELLDAVREYSRRWLRHEAEQFLGHYGVKVDEQRGLLLAGLDVRHLERAGHDLGGGACGGSREATGATRTALGVGPLATNDEGLSDGSQDPATADATAIDWQSPATAATPSAGEQGGRGGVHAPRDDAGRSADGVEDIRDHEPGGVGRGSLLGEGVRPLEGLTRSLSATARHAASRFFDRVRGFLREAILAGAMALNGPGPLDEADLHEVDRQHAEQASFLAAFAREVETFRTPKELADPSGLALIDPMTAAQFAARVESYGMAPWIAAVNLNRSKVVRSGRATKERRLHRNPNPEAHACKTCLRESDKGWSPVGSLLPIGDAECLTSCDCFYEFMNDDGTVFSTLHGLRRVA
jgi:hypothetical protein